MRRSRYREEQIIGILKEHQAGNCQSAAELWPPSKYGVSGATFYKWRSKYGGMEVSDARKLKGLEDEIPAPEEAAGGIDAGCGDAARATCKKLLTAQIAEEGRGLGDDGD